jgi:hypothetical protein
MNVHILCTIVYTLFYPTGQLKETGGQLKKCNFFSQKLHFCCGYLFGLRLVAVYNQAYTVYSCAHS